MLKKITFATLPLLFALHAQHAFAQAETERGGGDNIVQEFRAIQYDVLNNIKEWRAKGFLKISDSEHKQVLSTVKKLLVIRKERVYLEDEANGEPQGQEVTIVNYRFANPPRLEIGGIRWKEITSALDKETLVLHELLSVSKIKDSAFERSYLMKLKTTEAWLNFKSVHRSYLYSQLSLDIDAANVTPTGLLASLKTTQGSSDYKKCMDSEDQSHKEQDEACTDLWKFIISSMDESNKSNVTGEMEKIVAKSKALNLEYNQWIKSQPDAWAKMSLKIMNEYLIYNSKLMINIASSKTPHALKQAYETSYGTANVGMVQSLKNFYNMMENQFIYKQKAIAKYSVLQLQKEVRKLDTKLAKENI